MNQFIVLTTAEPSPLMKVRIRLDAILDYHRNADTGGSVVHFNEREEGSWHVAESPEQIDTMIRRAADLSVLTAIIEP